MKKLFFPKRIPEPRAMGVVEFQAFNNLSKQNYTKWFKPLTDSIIESYGSNKGKILDVACGPGILTKELSLRSKNFQVFGLDNSTHALKLAKQNCKGIKNAKFVLGSADKLPFDNDSFDLVVCKDSLHHFRSGSDALKEILRTVKPGGTVYIQDMRRDLPNYFIQRTLPLDNPIKKLQYYSVRASYTKPEIKSIVSRIPNIIAKIFTRRVDKETKNRYRKDGVSSQELKDSFQSRYVLILKKK